MRTNTLRARKFKGDLYTPRGCVSSDFAYYYTKMAMKTLFSVGPGVFTDEEFERAVAEIAKPDLEGWEFFIESMNTKIYRKYKEVCRCRPLSRYAHDT